MPILFRNRDQLCHNIHVFLAKVYIFQRENTSQREELVKENVFFYQMIFLPQRLDNRKVEKNAE